MHWTPDARLTEKFSSLRSEADTAARGAGLELFLAELFGREHFRVEPDFVAGGRQIDLFVIRGGLRLLVEAKWTTRRAQHDAVDGLRARMQDAAPGVVGLLVSISGFSENVIQRVEQSTNLPILLMDGAEVEAVIGQRVGLHSLVQSKLDHLVRNRKALVGQPAPGPATWMDALPESGLEIIDRDGSVRPYWESVGQFSEILTSVRMPDLDSARAGGVRLTMRLGVPDSDQLVVLLTRLAQLGWLSSEGSWRIEQREIVWSGLGPAELGRQLTDWESRYASREMHSYESVFYVSTIDDGMLTVSADVAAAPGRLVRWCELSFVLPGVPLDQTPYEALTAELPVLNNPTFTIMTDDPARIGRPTARRARLTPLAYLVRTHPSPDRSGTASWVEGLITSDPMPRASASARIDAALPVAHLGHVFVGLRQHHRFDDDVTYTLLRHTLVQGSSVTLLHVSGDWDYTTSIA